MANGNGQIQAYTYQPRVPPTDLRTASGLMAFGRERFMSSMPEGSTETVDGIIQSAMLAMSKNPKILLCTQSSIYESVLTACRLGLDCSGILGSAYLVPYKAVCTLLIGYRGLADLARRASGAIRIDAQVVYEGDTIEIELGTNAFVKHSPSLTTERRAETIVGTYAVVQLTPDAPPIIEWMPIAEVGRIRARSPACDSGPWVTDRGEMARKTSLRRILKRVPVSVVEAGRVLAEAIEHDNTTDGLADRGAGITPADRTTALEKRLAEENDNAKNGE